MTDRQTLRRLVAALSPGDLLMALAFVLLLVNLMPGPNEDRLTIRTPGFDDAPVQVAALSNAGTAGAGSMQRSAYGGYLAELERRAEMRRAGEMRQP